MDGYEKDGGIARFDVRVSRSRARATFLKAGPGRPRQVRLSVAQDISTRSRGAVARSIARVRTLLDHMPVAPETGCGKIRSGAERWVP
jgi:hypothetical protein